jgi:hypothetical protein
MYTFKVSTKQNKKYDVFKNGKYLVSFGDKRYGQFQDKTPLQHYAKLNHFDNTRRQNYYKRHGINPVFESAKYFSSKFLW